MRIMTRKVIDERKKNVIDEASMEDLRHRKLKNLQKEMRQVRDGKELEKKKINLENIEEGIKKKEQVLYMIT